jgi:hypothetical protein
MGGVQVRNHPDQQGARSPMNLLALVADRFERHRALPSHVPVAIRQALRVPGGIDAEARFLARGDGFTCLPGRGDTHPPMCADQPSMQWFEDFAAHRPKPTNTVPGVTYMLAGATQRSDSNPYDDSSPLIKIGPHWMIMWPFDPTTTGLPNSHRSTGAYIMWSGTPDAHLHVMGNPYGH